VKAQSAAFLAKSREFLDKAHDLFGAHHWPDEAGRAAYLAGLHAAQALIFETTGQLRKRHSIGFTTDCGPNGGCKPPSVERRRRKTAADAVSLLP
jgi:hypothetical protein